MSSPTTSHHRTEMSPRTTARVAGVVYLSMLVLAGFGGKTQDALVIPGDASITAANILGHITLLRQGFTAYLAEMACNVAVTWLMYDLMKPVSRRVSMLAAWFSIVAIIVKTFSRLFLITPIYLLGGTAALHAFTDAQLQSLSMVFLHLNAEGAGLAMAFFGFSTVLTGWLTLRSTFLPRWLGALGIVAGLGWLTFLWLPFGLRYVVYISAFALLVAVAKILWFLVVGVDEEKWIAEANASLQSIWR